MLSDLLGNSRNLKYWGSVIHICIVDLLDEIMVSLCCLINLIPCVVNKRKKCCVYIQIFHEKSIFLFLNVSYSKYAQKFAFSKMRTVDNLA